MSFASNLFASSLNFAIASRECEVPYFDWNNLTVLSEKSTGKYASIPRSFAPSTIASAASSSVASKTLVKIH